jgi:hypothetical protein
MNDTPKTNDIVDTTDCLEAISSFKSMKNFMFLICFLCLLVLQGAFWLNHLGYVEADDCPCAGQKQSCSKLFNSPAQDDTNVIAPPTEDPKVEDKTKEASKVASKEEIDAAVNKTLAVESEGESEENADIVPENGILTKVSKFIPSCKQICVAVKICNFVLVISATIYCLILLLSVKISLAGRMGGISHISRAFFASLFALAILLPWQKIFPGVVLGAIFTPAELMTECTKCAEGTLVCNIMYYLRFVGMPIIVFLLLLVSQARSAKWSKTTLRRLGILH